MSAAIFTWRGKALSECTREELIAAVNSVMSSEQAALHRCTVARITDLEKELKIKDEFIEQLIAGKKP